MPRYSYDPKVCKANMLTEHFVPLYLSDNVNNILALVMTCQKYVLGLRVKSKFFSPRRVIHCKNWEKKQLKNGFLLQKEFKLQKKRFTQKGLFILKLNISLCSYILLILIHYF